MIVILLFIIISVSFVRLFPHPLQEFVLSGRLLKNKPCAKRLSKIENDRTLTESQILTFYCHLKDEKESKLQGK